MKRCIACRWWLISSKPFTNFGYCIHPCVQSDREVKLSQPGYGCKDYELYVPGPDDTDNLMVAKRYLLALIGRERAEVGTPAHDLFSAEIGELYKQLTSPMQLNVHEAFRVFLTNPNVEVAT